MKSEGQKIEKIEKMKRYYPPATAGGIDRSFPFVISHLSL